MFKKHFGKIFLSVVVIAWALMNLFPLQDTDFDTYIRGQVGARKEVFTEILDKAQLRVDGGVSPSLFVALNEIGEADGIDYAVFFPQVNLADVRTTKKRNEILLQHLLNQSRGRIKLGLDLKGGVAFTLKVDDTALEKGSFLREQQLGKAVDIIASRVNGLGVAEPIIRIRGDNAIEVQLPGLSTKDSPDALDSLKKPAKLTFHRVHRTRYPDVNDTRPAPAGYVKMVEESTDSRTGKIVESAFYIKQVPEMGGSAIGNAFVSMNDFGGYEIGLRMTDDGAKRFADVTGRIAEENASRENTSRQEYDPAKYGRLAIVLDGQLYSAPRVTEAITSGNARISGQFSQREAIELANVLNNPLEVELSLEEMYEIGPSLADDAKNASIKAAFLGAALVVAFMIAYYMVGGFVAVITVVLNLLIVMGVMASIGATLTLPGVAALVLTIGMAVDANILIFERIREELRAGKCLPTSLAAGFEKAFSTIVDANITTLLTAGILIWLGTGPVKGFGVILAIGIGATMFCALIVNRLLLEMLVNSGMVKTLMRSTPVVERKFDYLKWRKPAFLVSWVIVLLGAFVIYEKQDEMYGIDFTGGDEVTLSFAQKVPSQEIFELADSLNIGEVVPVYQTQLGTDVEILKIQTRQGASHELVDALVEANPDAEFLLIGESSIGAAVSDSIKWNALLAVGVAMLGILLYVAFRFELGFGMGAIVSTLHDVLMTIGIYVMLGGQFTAPMVAAILMVVGYSINDTIVVFDRIREELGLNPTMSLRQIINLAINRTLSRTLLTSLTTLMAALALYIFGAGAIDDFALVFMIGIVTGTFSSIFIASPVFYFWHKGDRKHVEERELAPKYDWEER